MHRELNKLEMNINHNMSDTFRISLRPTCQKVHLKTTIYYGKRRVALIKYMIIYVFPVFAEVKRTLQNIYYF